MSGSAPSGGRGGRFALILNVSLASFVKQVVRLLSVQGEIMEAKLGVKFWRLSRDFQSRLRRIFLSLPDSRCHSSTAVMAKELQEDTCYVALTHDHLDSTSMIDRVRSPKAGAIVLFAGKTLQPG